MDYHVIDYVTINQLLKAMPCGLLQPHLSSMALQIYIRSDI